MRFLNVMELTYIVSSMTSGTAKILYDLADRHGGYFTTGEASFIGLSYRQLSYYRASGALERVTQGVYRLIAYPPHRHGDMIATALWAGPESAISHESALVVYGLASAMPLTLHLTVPAAFRGKREGVRVHHGSLDMAQRRVWDDVPITSVERTLTDLTQTADRSLVREAVAEALVRGLTTRMQLASAADGDKNPSHIRRELGIRLPATRERV